MHRRLLAVVISTGIMLMVIAIAGCEDSSVAPVPQTPTVAPTPTGGVEPTAQPTFQGARQPVEGTLGARTGTPGPGMLIDVRAAGHAEGFDRIVFEFEGEPPDYRVEYVSQAVNCASGEPVAVIGPALLQVRFSPAQAHTDAGVPSLNRTDILLDLPSILNAVQTCDFEGVVTWVVGLLQDEDFAVIPLEDRLRLAVDVRHPSVTPTPIPGF
jgi:hypothetical protein